MMATGLNQNAQLLGQLIGTGLGLYGNSQDRAQQKEDQLAAANLLTRSYQLMETDPEASQAAFIQAQQLAPEFVLKAVQGLASQGKASAQPAENPMTEYQRQSLELRRQQQEIDRLKMQRAEETNTLRQQQLQAQIDKLDADLKLKEEKAATERASMKKSQDKSAGIAREAATLAREIAEDSSLPNVTGTVTTILPVVRGESQDLINKAQRLESMLTYENLSLMSGVLTDRDIQFLGRLASGLSVSDGGIKGSTEGVRKRLLDIANKIDAALGAGAESETENGGVPAEPESARPAQPQLSPAAMKYLRK